MSDARNSSSIRRLVGHCLAALAFAAGSATAAPITYEYTAEITVLNNLVSDTDPVPGLSLGDVVTGSFTYETGRALNPGLNTSRQELVDAGLTPLPAGTPGNDGFHAEMADDVSQSWQAVGGPGFGGDPIFSISFNIGGETFSVGGDSLVRHRTNEWVPTPDRPAFAYDTMIAFAGLDTGSNAGIRLMDDAVFAGTFPSDQTLSSLPDLADLFLARVFGSFDLDGDGIDDAQIFAKVNTLAVQTVPEPGTLLLVLSGLLLVRRRVLEI